MIPDQQQDDHTTTTTTKMITNHKVLQDDSATGGVITMAGKGVHTSGGGGQENGGGKTGLIEGQSRQLLQDTRQDQNCSRTSTPSSVSPSQPNSTPPPGPPPSQQPPLDLAAFFAAANQAHLAAASANQLQLQVPSNSTAAANSLSNYKSTGAHRRPSTPSCTSSPDVSPFPGKIVYNPDGSAYIIEDSNSSTEQFGCTDLQDLPRLASAHYLAKSNPEMHSYRVYSVREGGRPLNSAAGSTAKPILMCFICKLSFGYGKSFLTHSSQEHGFELNDVEISLVEENQSAILQLVGRKEVMIHFLEPVQRRADRGQGLEELLQQHSRTAPPTIDLKPLPSPGQGMDLRKSPSAAGPHSNSSSSPDSSPTPPVQQQQQHNYITGTTIGVCPEHTSGRPSGLECTKCELILNSSRLGLNQHTRNSCKTLKCPKCNWHYKYQETLEIHMKEKHPESETQCVYCIASQPHPRLARGETYTCGYKPYRCEVCNYSTTTKGNLSIHMQSDKHLNNMQELQAGVCSSEGLFSPGAKSPVVVAPPQQQPQPSPVQQPPPSPAPVRTPTPNKPRPSFRCDVCNYETNVARNLRIHMTSEKHTHNMCVLQQNVKHMQHLQALQLIAQQQSASPNVEASIAAAGFLQQLQQQMIQQGQVQVQGQGPSESELADIAYNQALLIQMLSGQPQQLQEDGLTPSEMDPPPDPPHPNPTNVFQCCICNSYGADTLEQLNNHLNQDRTKNDNELIILNNNYTCKLCSYKTNLKANFQLHCKTDKHLQRLQHVNHLREGGREWRNNNNANPVQLRCNTCDYYTNSMHKMQVHAGARGHEGMAGLLQFLLEMDGGVEWRSYYCQWCGWSGRGRGAVLQHGRSPKHSQLEQLHPGGLTHPFRLIDQEHSNEELTRPGSSSGSSVRSASSPGRAPAFGEKPAPPQHRLSVLKSALTSFNCPYCEYSTEQESLLQNHLLTQHSGSSSASSSDFTAARQLITSTPTTSTGKDHLCPLCQLPHSTKSGLEHHVINTHQVSREGLNRLLQLVQLEEEPEVSRRKRCKSKPTRIIQQQQREESEEDEDSEDDHQESQPSPHCTICNTGFNSYELLFKHQLQFNHFTIKTLQGQLFYSCWGCGAQFQSGVQVQEHYAAQHARIGGAPIVDHQQQQVLISERHVYKYRCNQCSLAFKTLDKLQLHSQYHLIRDASKCSKCGKSFRSIQGLERHECSAVAALEDSDSDSNNSNGGQHQLEDYLNSPPLAEDNYNDPSRKYKCHRCKLAFTRQSYLTSHNKTLLHRKGEKLNYPLEKYLDPNRPYKCEVCKESFTQKNILLVHFNSVSHLHKLKNASSSSSGMGSSTISSSEGASIVEPSLPGAAQQQSFDQPPQIQIPTSGQQSSSPTAATPPDEDASRKPFKCNICRVAYTQGSTLDIHMRSVLHQTRASKLQEVQGQQVDLVTRQAVVGGETGQQQTTEEQTEKPPTVVSSDDDQRALQQPHHRSSLYKHILQSYGFEVAMQYNEYNTSTRLLSDEDDLQELYPELIKSECTYCGHVFSSIWILKSHLEEVHNDQIDFGMVEEYAQGFRKKWEETRLKAQVEPPATAAAVESGDVEQQPEQSQQELQLQDLLNQMTQFGSILNPGLFLAAVAAQVAAQQQQSSMGQSQAAAASLMMMPPGYGQGNPSTEQLLSMGMGFGQFQQQPSANAGGPPPFIPGFGSDAKLQELLNKEYKPQQQQQPTPAPQQPPPAVQQPAKRARTRITDDQLKVLRAHFDINNSPSEEQIQSMALQSGLPPKVIKHWFRNTLFKERQRNKDSPYNFSNPPSTTLNLEEYEKTGEARVGVIEGVGVEGYQQKEELKSIGGGGKEELKVQVQEEVKIPIIQQPPTPSTGFNGKEQHGSLLAAAYQPAPQNLGLTLQNLQQFNSNNLLAYYSSQSHQGQQRYDSESEESEKPSTVSKKGKKRKKQDVPDMLPPPSTTPIPLLQSPSPSPTSSGLTTPPLSSSNSISGLSSGKRANRTRFTDYQIKVLQEFFENNAYPKDDDLEYLSKLLGLSPRVIVVWFQNARQKARKVYENQPPVELPAASTPPSSTASTGEENRFQRTPGLNYQCKKCLLVFQRYYELIRHQKTHCFKEEDAKRSAQAQAAAAQVACKLNNSGGSEESSQSDDSPQQPVQLQEKREEYGCEKCGVHYNNFEQWREHQLQHLMGFDQPGNLGQKTEQRQEAKIEYPQQFKLDLSNQQHPFKIDLPVMQPNLPYQLFQQQPINLQSNPTAVGAGLFKPHQQPPQQQLFDQLSNSSNETSLKRKYSTEDLTEDEDHNQQPPRDKRLRTTILPEQLDYLYQKYQLESNPSRKMLEQIAREVNLKKRVVQVWFQNTRARERKGQYRAHSQVINKKCPYCSAIFKVKSALESHLVTKHGEDGLDVDGIEELEGNGQEMDCGGGGVLDLSGKRSYGGAMMGGQRPIDDSDCCDDDEEDDSL